MKKVNKIQKVLVKNFTIGQLFPRFRRDVGFLGGARRAAIGFIEA
jgi:hypothetical protein